MIATIFSLALLGAAGADVEATKERQTLLYVATNPSGAEVLVDGKRVGTTDGLFPIEPGVRRVIVELEGHDQQGKDVTIRAGDITRLKLKLTTRHERVGRRQTPPETAKRHAPSRKDVDSATAGDRAGSENDPAATATAASILARLKNPREGWKVLESSTLPEDEVAKIGESLGGRIERISYMKLLADDKRFEVDRKPLEPDDKRPEADNKRFEVKVMECRTDSDAEDIHRAILCLMYFKQRSPGICLRFRDTLVEFVGGDRLGTVARAAAEDLGFAVEEGNPGREDLRAEDFVVLVVGKDRITFEGRETSWGELQGLLEAVPDRQQKTFVFARTTNDMTINEWNYKYSQVVTRARGFDPEFKGISFVGERPLGSQGVPYVRLVIAAEDNMTLEGHKTTKDELLSALIRVPNRHRTTLEVNRASSAGDEMTIKEWNNLWGISTFMAGLLGFKGSTRTGERPLGSKALPLPDRVGAFRRAPHYPPTQPVKGVHLPDADLPGTEGVLDLASGETFGFPEMGDPPDVEIFTRLGKGDLFFDRLLCCPRGAKALQWDGEQFVAFPPKEQIQDASAYELPALPCRLLITTAEKRHFDVTILSATDHDDGIDLEYRETDLAVMPDEPTPTKEPAPPQLNEAVELIERNYVVGLERPDLMEAAIRGMIDTLDPHSDYINQAELTALQKQLSQKPSGIGIKLEFDGNVRELRVISPLPKMPAYRAGIRARDTIVQIDGKPTSEFPQGKELETAATLLRGKPGRAVTVGVKHFGSDEVQQITIVREVIRLPAIKGDTRKPGGAWNFMLDEDCEIGYVRLIDFGPQSANKLRDALDALQSKGMKAFVFDLRNNPGGTLSQAIQVADLFLEDGIIVSIKDREEPGKTWFAKSEGTLGEFPMAVLVNGDSVAAAEIVAACLQDHGRASIVGERTYGKGTAHKILEFKDGDGALKLPTAIFLRPNGKGIHRFDGAEEWDSWGVVPDEECEVNLSTEEYRRFIEYRQQRDVFSPEGPPASDFVDRQLQKAIECLSNRRTKS